MTACSLGAYPRYTSTHGYRAPYRMSMMGLGQVAPSLPEYTAAEKQAIVAKLGRMEVAPRLMDAAEMPPGAEGVFVRAVVVGATPPGRGNALAWARQKSAAGKYVLAMRFGLTEPMPAGGVEGGALLALPPEVAMTLPGQALAVSPVLFRPGEGAEVAPAAAPGAGWWASLSTGEKATLVGGVGLVVVGGALVASRKKRGYAANRRSQLRVCPAGHGPLLPMSRTRLDRQRGERLHYGWCQVCREGYLTHRTRVRPRTRR